MSGPTDVGRTMRVLVSDGALVDDLITHLRTRGYLATSDGSLVSVVPINVLSERADRKRFERDLELWRAEHPGVLVAPAST